VARPDSNLYSSLRGKTKQLLSYLWHQKGGKKWSQEARRREREERSYLSSSSNSSPEKKRKKKLGHHHEKGETEGKKKKEEAILMARHSCLEIVKKRGRGDAAATRFQGEKGKKEKKGAGLKYIGRLLYLTWRRKGGGKKRGEAPPHRIRRKREEKKDDLAVLQFRDLRGKNASREEKGGEREKRERRGLPHAACSCWPKRGGKRTRTTSRFKKETAGRKKKGKRSTPGRRHLLPSLFCVLFGEERKEKRESVAHGILI